MNRIDTDSEVRAFWNDLASCLQYKATRDGMTDVFGMYRHLFAEIEADADKTPEHREMLTRALAIRDSH